MSGSSTGELIWLQRGTEIELCVYAPPKERAAFGGKNTVKVSNLRVPLVQGVSKTAVLFRHPISLTIQDNAVSAGPVFAILAGQGDPDFIGSRSNFRDLIRTARQRNTFIYVLTPNHVNGTAVWQGYVRLGNRNWKALPCPKPEAVYNRIPNRKLERRPETLAAKEALESLNIPMFNPGYFSKATIYALMRNDDNLARYLPDTAEDLTYLNLEQLLDHHEAVYLKPSGGSIGHGMLRIQRTGGGYQVRVQKNTECQGFIANDRTQLWKLVSRHRLQGQYVIQSAVKLLQWEGRPCDFRVLLQKQDEEWRVVGKGVRVAGTNTITTHVPNGGHIADAHYVLEGVFGPDAGRVDAAINEMVIECAMGIDRYYENALGEMSMDVGVDMQGAPWFFEANAKPMKFDELDIRQRSLDGVLRRLEELRSSPLPTNMEGK